MIISENDGSAVNKTDTVHMPHRPLFDTIISDLPQTYKNEITETDKYLKTIRPLKFKRIIDKKAQKITYVASDYGISYMFKISDEKFTHNFQWYIVYNGKPETWHRRADYMEEALVYIEKNDHPLSVHIYDALKRCPGGDNCYGERCLARTLYAFNDQKRLTCHGSVELGMNQDDFRAARKFFNYLNELIEDKITSGEPPQEKIILYKTIRSIT